MDRIDMDMVFATSICRCVMQTGRLALKVAGAPLHNSGDRALDGLLELFKECGLSVEQLEAGGLNLLEGVSLGSADDEAEPSLGDHVKHSVEDGFAVGGDGAGAFGKDPDDGVQAPGKDGQAHGVVEADKEPDVREYSTVLELDLLVASSIVDVVVDGTVLALAEVVDDGEEVEQGESEEDPLVRGADGGANEAGGDHEDVLEEEEVPHVVIEATKVAEGVEHEGGGDDPVEVASVVELAAIAAADVETVVGGHSEVRKGGDEAHNTADERRLGKELEHGLTNLGTNAMVLALIHNVSVKQVAVDVVDSGQEEENEANPKSDGARPRDAVIAGVNVIAVRGGKGLAA